MRRREPIVRHEQDSLITASSVHRPQRPPLGHDPARVLQSLIARSEDDRAMSKAAPTLLIDNERVRVTQWRFAPGAATGWHRHAMDYVVVPMGDGVLELVGPDDARTRVELKNGMPYFRNAAVEHDVINANAFEFTFVEVELK
jgi:beta-alanine degradation protein BauB